MLGLLQRSCLPVAVCLGGASAGTSLCLQEVLNCEEILLHQHKAERGPMRLQVRYNCGGAGGAAHGGPDQSLWGV